MFKEDGNVIHFAAPKGKVQPQKSVSVSPPYHYHFLHPSCSRDSWFPVHILAKTFRTVHASVPSNTFAIYGTGEDKELTELVPGILNQLGPDSLASLRKLAESYQSLQKKDGGEGGKAEDEDDDDIPELVEGENFESKVEWAGLGRKREEMGEDQIQNRGERSARAK